MKLNKITTLSLGALIIAESFSIASVDAVESAKIDQSFKKERKADERTEDVLRSNVEDFSKYHDVLRFSHTSTGNLRIEDQKRGESAEYNEKSQTLTGGVGLISRKLAKIYGGVSDNRLTARVVFEQTPSKEQRMKIQEAVPSYSQIESRSSDVIKNQFFDDDSIVSMIHPHGALPHDIAGGYGGYLLNSVGEARVPSVIGFAQTGDVRQGSDSNLLGVTWSTDGRAISVKGEAGVALMDYISRNDYLANRATATVEGVTKEDVRNAFVPNFSVPGYNNAVISDSGKFSPDGTGLPDASFKYYLAGTVFTAVYDDGSIYHRDLENGNYAIFDRAGNRFKTNDPYKAMQFLRPLIEAGSSPKITMEWARHSPELLAYAVAEGLPYAQSADNHLVIGSINPEQGLRAMIAGGASGVATFTVENFNPKDIRGNVDRLFSDEPFGYRSNNEEKL